MSEPRTVEEALDTWKAADAMAAQISKLFRDHNLPESNVVAMALVLLSAEDCITHNAVNEEMFVAVARAAFRLRYEIHKSEMS